MGVSWTAAIPAVQAVSGAGGVGCWRAEAARWRAEAELLAGCRVEAARWRAEAEALAGCVAEAQRLVAEEAVLRARVADLEGQVCVLTGKVPVLAKAGVREVLGEEEGQTDAGG